MSDEQQSQIPKEPKDQVRDANTDDPAYLMFQQDGENDFSVSMKALPYKELLMQRK